MVILSSPVYLINSKPPVLIPLSPLVPDSPRSPVLNSPKFPGMDVQPHKTCPKMLSLVV